MKPYFILLTFGFFFFLACSRENLDVYTSASLPVNKDKLVGVYEYPKRYGGSILLELRADGTFEQKVVSDQLDESLSFAGRWLVSKDNLELLGLWITSLSNASERAKIGEKTRDGFWIIKESADRYIIFGGDTGDPDYYHVIERQNYPQANH